MKKLQKLDDFAILKKGIGIKSQKIYLAVRIGIADALELTFCSIKTIEFHLVCIVF